jgi:hypothetical protein
MSLEGTVERLETLRKNIPKYAPGGTQESREVYEKLEDNYLGLLEEVRRKYGPNHEVFIHGKNWYLHHKGIENL